MEDILTRLALNIDKLSWEPVKFGDVAFEPKETCNDILKEGIEHVVGLEHIITGDIRLRNSATIEESTTFSKKFQTGDVLFGRRRAYLRKAAQASFGGICSGDITVFRAKKNLLPALLPFIVSNDKFFDYAIKHSAGGLSPRVKFKDLANYQFLLPPKEEQAQLAELLWAMDEVIEKFNSLDIRLELLKKRILNDLFRKEWAIGNQILGRFEITDFPLIRFSEVCEESMFGPRFSSNEYSENGDVACLRTTDLSEEGVINFDSMPRALLPKGKFKEHYLREGDLVISRSGTCGLTAVFKNYVVPVLPAAFLIRFRIKKYVNPQYLKLFFNSEIGKKVTTNLSTGAVQKNLTSKALLGIEIPIPSEIVQNQILSLVENLNIDKVKSQAKRSKILQKSLINQIF